MTQAKAPEHARSANGPAEALARAEQPVLSAERRHLLDLDDFTPAEITGVLRSEVIKRDTLEGPEAAAAVQRVNRGERTKILTRRADEAEPSPAPDAAQGAEGDPAP